MFWWILANNLYGNVFLFLWDSKPSRISKYTSGMFSKHYSETRGPYGVEQIKKSAYCETHTIRSTSVGWSRSANVGRQNYEINTYLPREPKSGRRLRERPRTCWLHMIEEGIEPKTDKDSAILYAWHLRLQSHNQVMDDEIMNFQITQRSYA